MYSDIHLRIYLSHERRLARKLEKSRLAHERKATTVKPRETKDEPRPAPARCA